MTDEQIRAMVRLMLSAAHDSFDETVETCVAVAKTRLPPGLNWRPGGAQAGEAAPDGDERILVAIKDDDSWYMRTGRCDGYCVCCAAGITHSWTHIDWWLPLDELHATLPSPTPAPERLPPSEIPRVEGCDCKTCQAPREYDTPEAVTWTADNTDGTWRIRDGKGNERGRFRDAAALAQHLCYAMQERDRLAAIVERLPAPESAREAAS